MADPDLWSKDYRTRVRKAAWALWKKDVQQRQGFVSGVGLAAGAAVLFWLTHGHDIEALKEVELVGWTVPVLIFWLAYRWFTQREAVHESIAAAGDTEVDEVRAKIVDLEKRLRPTLRIDGGNGSAFDRRIPVMEVYERLERARALEPGAYVMEDGLTKVLRVTNDSDVGIESVRIEVAFDNDAQPTRIPWLTGEELIDIAPRSSQHAFVGMMAKLGVSLPGGGTHEYVRSLGYSGLRLNSEMSVKAWTPNGVAATRRFRVEVPYGLDLLRSDVHPWLPIFTAVEAP